MNGQLQLTTAEGGAAPVLFSIDVPDRLMWRARGLSAAARVELATRAPEVLHDLVATIAYQDEMDDIEVDHRIAALRRDLERLEQLRRTRTTRRNRCPDCGAHRAHPHADGCSRAPLGLAPLGQPPER